MNGIPTPKEFFESRASHLGPEIERCVETILAAMRREVYYGKYTLNQIQVPAYLQDLVKRAFAAKGWVLEFKSDQREGEWISITHKAP
jgi:hypothetical protein